MILIFVAMSILHFCFQTDGSVPNTLVIANCEVVKPRVAAAEHISQVLITFSSLNLVDSSFCNFVTHEYHCGLLVLLFSFNCFFSSFPVQ